MKVIHELIKTIEKSDTNNIEKLKPIMLKLARMSVLSFGNEEKKLTAEKIEEIYNMWLMPFGQDQEFLDEIESLTSKLNSKFIKAYESLIDSISERGYRKDAIELSAFVLRSIGGKARGIKLHLGKKKKLLKYCDSEEQITDLKTEISRQLREQSCESPYVSALIINGLVCSIKENLDEMSRQLAGTIRAMISMDNRTIEELESNEILGKYFDPQYPKELKWRIYLWDKLTVELRNEYSIDEIIEN